MRPSECPKWERCNAPTCPLDPNRLKCRHLNGEPVCLWLRERAKPGGRAAVATALPTMQAEAVEAAYSDLCASGGPIAHELRKASRYGSKLAAANRFRGREVESEAAT